MAKNNIPVGQFQRLTGIYDTEKEFEWNVQDMCQKFKTRGYQQRTILRAYNKTKCLPREKLFSKIKSTRSDNVYTLWQNVVIQPTKLNELLKEIGTWIEW